MYVLEDVIRAAQSDPNMADLHGRFRDMAEKIREMVSSSAPITHKDGNKRYMDYIFLVEGGRVSKITKLSTTHLNRVPDRPQASKTCTTCQGVGSHTAYDECEYCGAVAPYCKDCDEGWVAVSIPCQDCCK